MSTSERGRARGQTSIDFVFGIAIFLVTFGFVATFVPGIVAPFSDEPASPVVADRVADELVGSTLADASALDESCTQDFFAGSGGAGCPFDPTDPLTDRIGVAPDYEVNVTVGQNDPSGGLDAICVDADGDIQPCGSGGTRLRIGGVPPTESKSVMTARRVAILDDTDVMVVVRIW